MYARVTRWSSFASSGTPTPPSAAPLVDTNALPAPLSPPPTAPTPPAPPTCCRGGRGVKKPRAIDAPCALSPEGAAEANLAANELRGGGGGTACLAPPLPGLACSALPRSLVLDETASKLGVASDSFVLHDTASTSGPRLLYMGDCLPATPSFPAVWSDACHRPSARGIGGGSGWVGGGGWASIHLEG
jgi:hypothetical protein